MFSGLACLQLTFTYVHTCMVLAQGRTSVRMIAPSTLWLLIMASIIKNSSSVLCAATVSGGLPQCLARVKTIMDSQDASHACLGVADGESFNFSIGSVELSKEDVKLMNADFGKLAEDYFPSQELFFGTLALQLQQIGTTKESVLGIELLDEDSMQSAIATMVSYAGKSYVPYFLYRMARVRAKAAARAKGSAADKDDEDEIPPLELYIFAFPDAGFSLMSFFEPLMIDESFEPIIWCGKCEV